MRVSSLRSFYWNLQCLSGFRRLQCTVTKHALPMPSTVAPSLHAFPITYWQKKHCHTKVPLDGMPHTLGKIERKFQLMYKCKSCDGHNSHLISHQAYEHGVVIVTCENCNTRHLIADNLNWFEDVEGKNIEEILAEKGELVLKVKPSSCKECE